MGAVRMRVQTDDEKLHNNPQVPYHSSPSIDILWSEKLHVCKKHIYNYGVLTLNQISAKTAVHNA